MKTNEFKVVVRTYNNVNVNVEDLTKHLNGIITNPIELTKYVNIWLYSRNCMNDKFDEDLNNQYNNICKRLERKYVQDENVNVNFYFSEDNWDIVVEISKNV